MPIVYFGIGILIGLFLAFYIIHKEFKNKVNSFFKGVYGFLSNLEFRQNHKGEDEISYDNYRNRGAYCVLPNHEKLNCGFDGYCKDCPIYKTYKTKEPPKKGKPQ